MVNSNRLKLWSTYLNGLPSPFIYYEIIINYYGITDKLLFADNYGFYFDKPNKLIMLY